jgi:hypothetical protein
MCGTNGAYVQDCRDSDAKRVSAFESKLVCALVEWDYPFWRLHFIVVALQIYL